MLMLTLIRKLPGTKEYYYYHDYSGVVVNNDKEYVSLLVELSHVYKNNGSLSCIGTGFVLISSHYLARTQLIGIRFT